MTGNNDFWLTFTGKRSKLSLVSICLSEELNLNIMLKEKVIINCKEGE